MYHAGSQRGSSSSPRRQSRGQLNAKLDGAAKRLQRCFLLFASLLASGRQTPLGLRIVSQFLPRFLPLLHCALILRTCYFRNLPGNTCFVLRDKVIAFRYSDLVTSAGGG